MTDQGNPDQKSAWPVVVGLATLPPVCGLLPLQMAPPPDRYKSGPYQYKEGEIMAYTLPTIPDDKIRFYRELLFREVTNLFEWTGLPDEIPIDYLENTLIRKGKLMFFYEPEHYGYMALDCAVRGYNVYRQPVIAYTTQTTTETYLPRVQRTIVYNYTNDVLAPEQGCVLINNTYNGKSLQEIVDFYAMRMAMVQQAYDTNALWQNIPVVFPVPNEDTKLSLERMFANIYSGRPWIVVNELLMTGEQEIKAGVTEVPYLLDKLMDALNELRMKFHEAIGINTPGVDKKERLVTQEVESSKQATVTTLEVMLSQRKKACEEINNFFQDLAPSVSVRGLDAEEPPGGEGNGTDYNRIEGPPTD